MYRALMIWGVGEDDKNMPRHFSAHACCSFRDRRRSEAENFTREIRNHVEINYVFNFVSFDVSASSVRIELLRGEAIFDDNFPF